MNDRHLERHDAPSATLSFPTALPQDAQRLRHRRLGGQAPGGETIGLTNYYLEVNGTPVLPVMGEFHYSRYPHAYWEEEIRKIAVGGIDILSTYVFWNHHEEDEGAFDWTGDLDLRSFVGLCGRHGLRVVLRVGPFAHGECRNGGLPDWLYGQPFAVRSTDPRFLARVRRLYAQIAAQVEGMLFKDGGPVIGIQLDNEYMHAGAPWETTYQRGSEWVPAGSEGVAYMAALKALALAAGLEVPLYTCTAWLHSPVLEDEFLPLHGGYAFTPWVPDPAYIQPPTENFLFGNRHLDPVAGGLATYDGARYPYACCELGAGIQVTYQHRPVVPAACAEAIATVALGSGANLLGYYMYHGGSQRAGRRGPTNEYCVPRVSYDFQAPLGEYGQTRESYRSLGLLHSFLRAFGGQLAPMGVALPSERPTGPGDTATLRLAARATATSGFLFLTNYQDHLEMHDRAGVVLHVDTGEEILRLPSVGSFTVPREASMILPVNLALGDLRLIQATAQPLTRLEDPDGSTYVFFAVPGIAVEYVISGERLREIDAPEGAVRASAQRLHISASAGTGMPITLTAMDGARVRLLTLSREQALRSWKMPFAGHEHLIVSDSPLVPDGAGVLISHRGPQGLELDVYPPLSGGLSAPAGRAQESLRGAFARYRIPLVPARVDIRVTPLDDSTYLLHLPPAVLDQVADVFLRIDYVGDIAEAYLGGTLVSDNFCNGVPWEIGLKRFAERMVDGELLVKIVPLPAVQDGPRFSTTGMAVVREEGSRGPARIRGVEAEAVLAVHLEPAADPAPASAAHARP